MTVGTLSVQRAAFAVVQDLGRPGHADVGIAVNGALDQHAARTANILVGNPDRWPLLEVTGSELVLDTDTDILVAVTGAAESVLVDGHPRPVWELVPVAAGSRLAVPAPRSGLRSYLAVNGAIEAETILGSVAPDPLLGVGRRLGAGASRSRPPTARRGPIRGAGCSGSPPAAHPCLGCPRCRSRSPRTSPG